MAKKNPFIKSFTEKLVNDSAVLQAMPYSVLKQTIQDAATEHLEKATTEQECVKMKEILLAIESKKTSSQLLFYVYNLNLAFEGLGASKYA